MPHGTIGTRCSAGLSFTAKRVPHGIHPLRVVFENNARNRAPERQHGDFENVIRQNECGPALEVFVTQELAVNVIRGFVRGIHRADRKSRGGDQKKVNAPTTPRFRHYVFTPVFHESQQTHCRPAVAAVNRPAAPVPSVRTLFASENVLNTRSAGLVRDLRLFGAFTRRLRPDERPQVSDEPCADMV